MEFIRTSVTRELFYFLFLYLFEVRIEPFHTATMHEYYGAM